MSKDRFREVFSRLASETPDPPAFSDLETQQATPESPTWIKPWMAVSGAAAVVLIVIGLFGFLGGGGPDLAQPDEPTIDYINIELSMTVNPVCDGGSIVDNQGFDDATIEIWGPNHEGLTLMVVTFPDGSEERTVTEGDIWRPDRTWVSDPDSTNFRVVQCEGTSQDNLMLASGLSPDGMGTVIPAMFLAAPEPTFGATFRDTEPEKSAWNGISALRYQIDSDGPVGTQYLEVYVSDDDTQLLRQYVELEYFGIGTATIDIAVVERDEVPADSISISTAGLTVYEFNRFNELPPEACPVTIPSRSMTPPDTHPETPSGYPDNFWFGKDELFTSLPADGVYQPRKSVWWSSQFTDPGTESSPDITVTYTLLNSATPLTIVNDQGTNASTPEDGLFIIAGGDPPIQGCWQVMAVYKDSSLSYVYYNPTGRSPEELVVPDVVGMSVNRAQNVLRDALYQTSVVGSEHPTNEVCSQSPAAGTHLEPGQTVEIDAAPQGQCGSAAQPPPEQSLDFNPDYGTYVDSLGRTYYVTACPNNDVLVLGGLDAADGLPPIGQTDQDRVEGFVNAQSPNSDGHFLQRVGLVGLGAVPRNGTVWMRTEDGAVVVSQQPDYMIEGTITDDFRCPMTPIFYNGIPIAFVKEGGSSVSCPTGDVEPLTSQVVVFYNCPTNGTVPNPVPVIRPLQPGVGPITSAYRQLLAGPTDAEGPRGIRSFFGPDTANALDATSIDDDGDLVVRFNDLILANNASTSTGSALFLAELYATAFQFEEVRTVSFVLNDSCDAFWNWLQSDCQATSRSGWEAIQGSWDQ